MNNTIFKKCIAFILLLISFSVPFFLNLANAENKNYNIETVEPGLPHISYNAKSKMASSIISKNGGIIIQRAAVLPDFASLEQASRYYLSDDGYGRLFGIKDQESELKYLRESVVVDSANSMYRNRSFVRFQQVYNKIPVFCGELIVELDAYKNLLAVTGKFVPHINISIIPKITADKAKFAAISEVSTIHNLNKNNLNASSPELWIYNPIILDGPGLETSRLVWRTIVESNMDDHVKVLVLIDAELNNAALMFNYFDAPDKADNLLFYYQSGSIRQSFSTISDAFNNIKLNNN